MRRFAWKTQLGPCSSIELSMFEGTSMVGSIKLSIVPKEALETPDHFDLELETAELLERFKAFEIRAVPCRQLLIIEELEISKGHRAKGLGQELVKEALRIFGKGERLVLLEACPNEDGSNYEKIAPNDRQQAFKADEAKLIRFYQKLGFEQVAGTEVMVMFPKQKKAYAMARFSAFLFFALITALPLKSFALQHPIKDPDLDQIFSGMKVDLCYVVFGSLHRAQSIKYLIRAEIAEACVRAERPDDLALFPYSRLLESEE